MRPKHRFWYLGACFLCVSACADMHRVFDDDPRNDPIDSDAKLTRQDFKDLHNMGAYKEGDPQITASVMEPPIPDLAAIMAAPEPPKIGATRLVSVEVTDDVPLKDVLIELARLADVDIEVDAGISGGIAFRAKDRPFNEVIERIADLAGLRYSMKNNVLRVERDMPYIQTYPLDMLNIERASQGNISLSSTGGTSSSGSDSSSGTSSSSGSGGSSSGSSGGSAGSSSSSITAQSASDFWTKFEDSIAKILTYQATPMVSGASIASQPAVPAGAPADPAAAAAAPVPAAPAAGNSSNAGSFFSLNRQAGTLTVSASERQHAIIRRFLDAITGNASSQVLIEAKIVEVALNDLYQTGINWSQLGSTSLKFAGDLDNVTATDIGQSPATITVLKSNVLGSTLDISAAVKLLDEFGTTRALSSPRLNAINNQQALLSFVENVVYFKVECEVTDAIPGTGGAATVPAKIEITSTENKAPVGITLALQPSINRESNEVTLSVRPTLTKITRFVSDPGFQLCKAQAAAQLPDDSPILTTLQSVDSQFPQMESRELDSILKIQSGQIMVIGGLLEDRIVNTDVGVPGVGEIPYFGNLFKNTEKSNAKKELVILIRATIVGTGGYVDGADKAIYQKFIQDPRPIEFPATPQPY